MDNMDNFNHQDHPPSFEEGELTQQVSENQPPPKEMKPPAVEDNFTPHQLKSKRRRASLPSRCKMDDRNSIILHSEDDRTDLQKLKSVIRKLQHIHTKEEIEFYCKVCRRDLLIPEQSPKGVSRGRAFIHKLLKHYRSTRLLSLEIGRAHV